MDGNFIDSKESAELIVDLRQTTSEAAESVFSSFGRSAERKLKAFSADPCISSPIGDKRYIGQRS